MANKTNKTRAYCFTINNYTTGTEVVLKQKATGTEVVYMVWSREVGESGTPHLQGYVYFKNPRTMKGVQSTMFKGLGAAMFEAMGTAQENRKYIIGPYIKEGKVKPYNPEHEEFGTIPKQGERVDLQELSNKIMSGELTTEDILIQYPTMYHQYGRTLNATEDLYLRSKTRTWMTKGLWIWGKTGTGKSFEALKGFGYKTHYVHNLNDNGWWDGYRGQEIVVFNEFRGQITFSELLDLCDWVPKTVKRRGREPIPFLAKLIIITSSKPPSEVYHQVYENDPLEGWGQLTRRFVVEQKCSRGNIELSRYLTPPDEEEEILEYHKQICEQNPTTEFEEF